MNWTFGDLIDRLKQEDEVTILELLDLTTEDLVTKLEDIIFDKQDRLLSYYYDEDCDD